MTTIGTADGLRLAVQWDDAAGKATGVVVLCHPHPLDGGTMRAPLMERVAARLTRSGGHVLRFNFRGVGTSEGSWGGGSGEVMDVAAAIEAATLAFPDLPLGVAGWSFGATTSLRWQLESGSTHPWAGIAPGIRSYRGTVIPEVEGLLPAERLIVVGDRDQFASVEEMVGFGARCGARVEVLEGSDHFFVFREQAVADLVAAHLLVSGEGA